MGANNGVACTSTPALSVVMPAYQVAGYIAESIVSVLMQTRTDWELIIVDDGSRDNLSDIVAPFLSDPRISLHRFDNGGLAVARNRGITLAKGEFIALLDGDDLYEPTYLARLSAALEAEPDIAFVTCDAVMFGVPEREGHRYSRYEPQVAPITIERVLRRQFNVFGLSMVRADVLRAVGGYSAVLKAAEDYDLWIRILAAGGRGAYVDEPLVRYRRRAGSLSNSPELLRKNLAAVYLSAMRLLDGHPAEAVCRARLVHQLAVIDFIKGQQALRDGDAKLGHECLVRALRVVSRPRWRLMLPVLRYWPAAATALFSWRERRRTSLERLGEALPIAAAAAVESGLRIGRWGTVAPERSERARPLDVAADA